MSTPAMRTIKLSCRFTLIAVLGLAGGCLYRLPILQGNVLNSDLVSQLEPGMTRSQVMFLLGTPMLPNGFDTDRWDYYCYAKSADSKATKRLTVWFKNEKVDHFDGDALPKAGAPRDICSG
jgi:outer membrane protein assembly factor BamE (lipoprotein component of BamABCDE complex)